MIVAVPAQIWLLWLTLLVDVCDGLLVDLTGYRSLIVTLHNRYRAAERAADMKEMTWDPYLERRAAEWSEQCSWGHQGGGLGENLAMFWTRGPQISITNIISQSLQNWWNEKFTWSWDTICGSACHYTQMVWAKTDRIGCSLSKCASLTMDRTEAGSGPQNADYLVCFYNPPGNYMGQYPFTPGQSCELCDSGEVCRNRICSKQGGRGKPYRQNYLPYRSSRTYQSRRVTTWGSEAGRSEARGSEERGRESWGRPQQYSNTGEGMSETASEASEL